MTGFLALEDGTIFRGRSVAAEGTAFGEAVFTTAMTGYQEIATDPSYAEQIICFTAPMIGNYGVSESRDESRGVAASGVLMRRVGGEKWRRWLAERGVVALEGMDTRSLVLRLRSSGAMRAAIVAGDLDAGSILSEVRAWPGWKAVRSPRRSRRRSRTASGTGAPGSVFRLRLQALDRPPSRPGRCDRDRLAARRRRRRRTRGAT